MKKTLIWLGVGSLLAGTALWVKYQAEMSGKLSYKMKNIKIKKVAMDNVVIEFDLAIQNPTELSIGLRGLDIDVLANGAQMTHIHSGVSVRLEPGRETLLPLQMTLNPSSLVSNLDALMQTGFSLKDTLLTFKGRLKLHKFGLPIPVPFSYTETYGEMLA